MSYLHTIKVFVLAYQWYVLGGLILIVATSGAIWRANSSETPQNETGLREVRVARVSDLTEGSASLSTVAEVRSVNEAKINTEASGRITRVRAELGDSVGAGQIIAEIENGAQRAAVLQAEGAFDAAKASAQGSRGSAVTTILTAYGTMDSAVEDAVGQMVSDPESSQSAFTVSSKDTQALADIENMRPTFRPILERHEAQTATLSASSDFSTELALVEEELRQVRTYLDAVLKALNAGVPRDDITTTTISGYVADVTAARTAVTSSLSLVIAARTALEGTGSGASVSSSEASIKQAEGAYRAALANLEKTLIRSPISGTINNFSLKLGDYVAPSQQVAVVSNNGALEAVAYVTDEDRARISVGSKVIVDGTTGTITKIAPALDPVTRRIEVRIGLSREAAQMLTNGQSVQVELLRSETASAAPKEIAIPITALKMEANRSIVFTVNAENKLVAQAVTTGAFSGSLIEITDGLTADTEIVADARGLKEGDTVAPVR